MNSIYLSETVLTMLMLGVPVIIGAFFAIIWAKHKFGWLAHLAGAVVQVMLTWNTCKSLAYYGSALVGTEGIGKYLSFVIEYAFKPVAIGTIIVVIATVIIRTKQPEKAEAENETVQ